jgi:hypothetical protein
MQEESLQGAFPIEGDGWLLAASRINHTPGNFRVGFFSSLSAPRPLRSACFSSTVPTGQGGVRVRWWRTSPCPKSAWDLLQTRDVRDVGPLPVHSSLAACWRLLCPFALHWCSQSHDSRRSFQGDTFWIPRWGDIESCSIAINHRSISS